MNNKKGFTLAELVVALALLGIATTVIVSFSMTVAAHIDNYQNTSKRTEDIATVKEMIVQWVSHFDNDDYDLQLENGQLVAVKVDDATEKYYLQFLLPKAQEPGSIVAHYEKWTGTYQTKAVIGIRFIQTNINGNNLFHCYVNFESTKYDSDSSTFEFLMFVRT